MPRGRPMAFVDSACSQPSLTMGLQREWDISVRSNGLRAYALELWAESRERVADELRDRADCLARLGLVNEAATDRYVSCRLRDRAVSDRIEATHLWRCANVANYRVLARGGATA